MLYSIKHRTHFAEVMFFVSILMIIFFMSMPISAADPFAAAYGGFGHEKMATAEITSDGGVIAVGQTDSFGAGDTDIWLVKLDDAGKIKWQKAVGGSGFDTAHSVHQIVGGYIVAGVTTSDDGNKDIAVIKLDSGGAIQWQKTYGGTAPEDKPIIHPTGDGFILCAQTASFGAGETDIQVLRLDSDGNMIWQKTYGGAGSEKNPFILPTSGGGYIMACSSDSFVTDPDSDSDILVLKLNNNGTIVWQKSYGGDKFESEPVIRQKDDGTYIIGASTQSFGTGFINILLFQLDNTGLVEWSKVFGKLYNVNILADIRVTGDGYIVAENSINSGNNIKIALFKVDTNGEIDWQKRYDNDATGAVTACAVNPAVDGKYWLTGSRYSNDFIALRTDETGSLPGCNLDNLSDLQTNDVAVSETTPVTVSENTTVNPFVVSLSSSNSEGTIHYFCNAPGGAPQIETVSDTQTLEDGSTSAEIWAQATDGGNGIDKVWAVIAPPDKSGSSSDSSEIDAVRINLVYDVATNRYVGNYDEFKIFGEYKITFYAQDSVGNTALPKATKLIQDAAPDLFEDDDNLSQALTIIPDIFELRQYNFYDTNDEDWVKFYGAAGRTYTLNVENAESSCNAVITLYDANGSELGIEDWNQKGDDKFLEYSVTQNGIYYVKINQHPSDPIYGKDTGYNFKIYRLAGPAAAIFEGDIRSSSPIGSLIADSIVAPEDFLCSSRCILSGDHFYIDAIFSVGAYRFKVFADEYYQKSYQFVVFPDYSVWIDSDFETYKSIYLEPLPKNPSEPTTTSTIPTNPTTTSTVPTNPTTTSTILTNPTTTSTIPANPTTTSATNQNSSSLNVVPVYRLYSEGLMVHLFTTDENEKNTLEKTDVWRYEGIAWYVFSNWQNGVVPVYRLYSEGLKIHLFTIDENEKNTLEKTDVWRYEGIAWYVFPNWQDSLVPIYRLYSEGLRKHLYTRDENEKNTLEKTDVWRYEAIAYYAYQPSS